MNGEQLCFVVLVIGIVGALGVLGPLYAAYERAVAAGTVSELRGYPRFLLRLFQWVAQGEATESFAAYRAPDRRTVRGLDRSARHLERGA